MSLSSPQYLFFLAVVTVFFYVLPAGRPRAGLLLAASYLFYVNLSGIYAAILLFVTVTAYGGAILLASRRDGAGRRLYFVMCCVALLAPLFLFKYANFFFSLGSGLFGHATVPPLLAHLILPIGISFFTFAALGYVIDVYLEVLDGPERRPVEFALFLAFFPLVTAGPIERGGHFIPQFDLAARFDRERTFSALRLIFIGLFLKVFCADTLVVPVDQIYAAPQNFSALEKLCGLIYYMTYIYCDFAGYSLIAIGSGRLLGLQVRPNFNQPYLSTTIPEFWRNWHISLSSWVRDYLFMPLRMSWRRYRIAGMIGATLISFLILGLWHGAGWGYILLGLMHGILVVASTYTLALRNRVWAFLRMPGAVVTVVRVVWTYALVMLTFVVYRANTLHDAATIYKDIFSHNLLSNIREVFREAVLSGHPVNWMQPITLTSWMWLILLLVLVGDLLASRKIGLASFPWYLQVLMYNLGAGLILYGWIENLAGQAFLYYKF